MSYKIKIKRKRWVCPICKEEFFELITPEDQQLHIEICHPDEVSK